MTPKAIIFTRCSSSGSLEGRQDTTRQVEDLQHYADTNHISVIRTYQEHQSGGLSNKSRPLLQEALSFCIDNHIDLILCSELSRLSRKCDELLETIKYLKDHHINCHFLKEQLSIFSPDGKENPYLTIMCAVLGTAAELEREAIKYRLNSGREKYIRDGGRLGKPKGAGVKTKEMLKEEYRSVIKQLRLGQSIRNTSKITGVSPATVLKVKRLCL
jgi:Site-specific recombinases, DNA invertase Pin homologs